MQFIRSITIYIFGSVLIQSASAQGIKATIVGFAPFQTEDAYTPYVGFGYDQNIGEKIGLSLDFNLSLTTRDEPGPSWTESYTDPNGLGYRYNYGYSTPWKELAFTSRYFISGNDGSWYLSSGIAFRLIKFSTVTENIHYDPPYVSNAIQFSNIQPKNLLLTPVTFRFGYRSDLEGVYGDFFIGYSIIPGGASKGSGNTEFDKMIHRNYFKNSYFCSGICVGFGWAK